MAVTLTLGAIAFHCRLTADPSAAPPFEVEAMLSPLVAWAADEVVLSTTRLCPDSAHNAAVLSLVAYAIDSPPASRHHGNAIANSGVVFILRRWLKRRAVSLTSADDMLAAPPWPTVEALHSYQQVGDWFTPPTGGIFQVLVENPPLDAVYLMYARIGDGSSTDEVKTDVRLDRVRQTTRVYLSPAFEYQVRTTGPAGARVWVT